MARNQRPNFGIGPFTGQVQFDDGDGAATLKEIVAGQTTYGSLVRQLIATSIDAADKVLSLWVGQTSGTAYQIGEVNVPDGSGTNGTDPAVNLLDAAAIPGLLLDIEGNYYLPLGPGYSLFIANKTTLTGGDTISVTAAYDNMGE